MVDCPLEMLCKSNFASKYVKQLDYNVSFAQMTWISLDWYANSWNDNNNKLTYIQSSISALD